jgi:hypothetical protein
MHRQFLLMLHPRPEQVVVDVELLSGTTWAPPPPPPPPPRICRPNTSRSPTCRHSMILRPWGALHS